MERGTGPVTAPHCGFCWLPEARPGYCAQRRPGGPRCCRGTGAAPARRGCRRGGWRKGRAESSRASVLAKAGTPLFLGSLREFKGFSCLSPESDFLKEVLPCGVAARTQSSFVPASGNSPSSSPAALVPGCNHVSQQQCGQEWPV